MSIIPQNNVKAAFIGRLRPWIDDLPLKSTAPLNTNVESQMDSVWLILQPMVDGERSAKDVREVIKTYAPLIGPDGFPQEVLAVILKIESLVMPFDGRDDVGLKLRRSFLEFHDWAKGREA